MPDLEIQLLETWKANQTANHRLLDMLDDVMLGLRYAPRVRTIGLSLIHLHNVRRRWLGAGGEIPDSVTKIDRKQSMTVEKLRSALDASAQAIRDLLIQAAQTGTVPGYDQSPVTFLGYLLAHEAHHRGQIMATLRISGYTASPDQIFGLWEWGGDSGE